MIYIDVFSALGPISSCNKGAGTTRRVAVEILFSIQMFIVELVCLIVVGG